LVKSVKAQIASNWL